MISSLAQRYPLFTFFLLAFSGTWLLFLPVFLGKGLGLYSIEEPFVSLLLMAGVFLGPLVSSLFVTRITEGKAGLKAFLRRFVHFRFGLGWYLLVILGYPLMYLVAFLPVLGTERYANLAQNLPGAIAVYLPGLVFSILFPALGEEPGWRGFALPRLQKRFGPIVGTLILGSLVALWHVPIYYIPGFTTLDTMDLGAVLVQSSALVSAAFLITWLYNHGRGSIFFAMLIHAASNSSPSLVKALLGNIPSDPLFQTILFGCITLLLIAFTRGRLAYKNPQT
jgi:uncharacterized protein